MWARAVRMARRLLVVRLMAPLTARVWTAYVAIAATASGLYVFGPVLQGSGPLFNVISGSSVIAILVGVHIHRPAAAWAWRWFAIGQGLFFLGDAYTYSYPLMLGHDVPFPSIGDAFYIAVYPALMIGILLASRGRNPQGDRAGVIDALIIAFAHRAPVLGLPDGSLRARRDALAAREDGLARLPARRRAPARRSASPGASTAAAATAPSTCSRRASSTLLMTDALYGYALLGGTFDHQVAYDAGWLVYYLLWGAAALHPSMRTFFEATPDRERRLSWQRARPAHRRHPRRARRSSWSGRRSRATTTSF